MRQIILASISKRRRQTFKLFNLKFKAVDSGFKEVMDNKLSPSQLVQFLALGKAKAAAKKYRSAIIIAADTVVEFQGKIIGKPKTIKEAKAMLLNFSGKKQKVITGLVVMDAENNRVVKKVVSSEIYFKKLTRIGIDQYIKSENPCDKAGGYNLQGGGINLLSKISGDFTNNLGLPMGEVFNALVSLEVEV